MQSASAHIADVFTIGIQSSSPLIKEIESLCSDISDIVFKKIQLSSLLNRITVDLVIVEVGDTLDDLQESINSIRLTKPSLPILAVTTAPVYETSVALFRMSIKDYLVLPSDRRRFHTQIIDAISARKVIRQQERLLDIKTRSFDFGQIIGNSPQLLETLSLTKKVISSDYMTALVLGETGTGKELLVKAIHYNSTNRAFPFVEIGCSAIPETLLESELFGHERGAFTDARDRKIGLFEMAGRGSIFLDEIGDISLLMQSKLLKVLEEKTMRRLGGVMDIPVQARIIAATSKNLDELVRDGKFRQDLYFRLRILPLILPPLRERQDDIPLLAEHFLQHFNQIHRKTIKSISPEAMKYLHRHTWHGNIRELKHAIERSVVLCESDILERSHFDVKQFPIHSTPSKPYEPSAFSVNPKGKTLTQMEYQLVNEVLRSVNGNKSKAAVILGVSRPRLDRILKQSITSARIK